MNLSHGTNPIDAFRHLAQIHRRDTIIGVEFIPISTNSYGLVHQFCFYRPDKVVSYGAFQIKDVADLNGIRKC